MPGDPEAEIEILESAFAGDFDLLEDGEGAEPARALVRIVERIDRRQPGLAVVGYGHGEQALVLAQFDEAGRTPVGMQEAREVLWLGIVHAAVGVPPLQVAAVQGETFVAEPGRLDADLEVGIAFQAAALGAVGDERIDRNAAGDAGAATRAVRDVDVAAGAPIAALQAEFVELVQMRRARIDDQILGRAFGKITAGMRQGLEQADDIGAHASLCTNTGANGCHECR